MKPSAFAYFRPTSPAEAIALLAEHGDEAKLLAGGQSLVAAMSFRLARPGVLIDINRIPGLDTIRVEANQLRIGALCRHARFDAAVVEGPLGTLLTQVSHSIAHTPIRSRGTFGGSLAHADPASEWCCVAQALDAEIVTLGPGGERIIPASEFFTTFLTTALLPEELLIEIRIPLLDAGWACGFAEYSRRAGDFALAMAVVALRVEHGVIRAAKLALGGVASTPLAIPAVAEMLLGGAPSEALWAQAAAAAMAAVNPDGDIHGSAEYRRDLAGAMLKRALRQAAA